jgi:hypothetical protein
LPREGLDRLITALREDGRRVIGPTVRDGAIVHAEIGSWTDLPVGVRDVQAPGSYRLTHDPERRRCFDFASAPTPWKAWTYPASVPISRSHRDGDTI